MLFLNKFASFLFTDLFMLFTTLLVLRWDKCHHLSVLWKNRFKSFCILLVAHASIFNSTSLNVLLRLQMLFQITDLQLVLSQNAFYFSFTCAAEANVLPILQKGRNTVEWTWWRHRSANNKGWCPQSFLANSVPVHLHWILSKLKRISRISTLPPLEKFLRTPMLTTECKFSGKALEARASPWITQCT